MAITITQLSGMLKIEGVESETIYVTSSNVTFTKNLSNEYTIVETSGMKRIFNIGDYTNVNGGLTNDAELEALLTGFFSNPAIAGGFLILESA